MRRHGILFCVLGIMTGLVATAMAQEHAKTEKTANTAVTAAPGQPVSSADTHDGAARAAAAKAATDDRIARLEGEKRFRTNCGRCHQAPHKFPPRVMATAIRHMRVRATITDEDMRLILRYMTQ
ncbi:MAG TPA: hypothetical protein VE263_17185 [Candidatus Angelobacter sp.]|nr:hypothetical protein [Candidatus Angelobacter sp.]